MKITIYELMGLIKEDKAPEYIKKGYIKYKKRCVGAIDYFDNYGNRNKKITDKLSKKINQYDLDDNFIRTWNSSMEIERTIGIDQSNVCLCCNGKRDTVGGYKWKYSENGKN